MREAGVVDLDAVAARDIDAGGRRRLVDAVLAPDQDRRAEALVHEGHRGADDLLLLAFGEHHALRKLADALEDAVERAGDRIAPGRELRLVGRACRRSAGARRRCPSRPCATAGGTVRIRRGSNGTGMM